MLFLALVVVGCGGGDTTVRRTRVPTQIPPTPTPRSTALPYVDDAPRVGDEDRPLVLLIAADEAADPTNETQRTITSLQRSLRDDLDLAVQVRAATEPDALQALCNGQPSAAWVSAFTFARARELCDVVPALAVKHGTIPNIRVGVTAEIIARSDTGTLENMAGKVFCRSQDHDYVTSWVVPSLVMAEAGINPLSDLSAIRDYPDDLTLGRALVEGDCDAAALPPDTFDDFAEEVARALTAAGQTIAASDVQTRLIVVSPAGDVGFPADPDDWEGYVANVFPYEVLVFAPEQHFPVSLREDMTETVQDFFSDGDDGLQRSRDLLDGEGVIVVDEEDYANFETLIAQAHWDMTSID